MVSYKYRGSAICLYTCLVALSSPKIRKQFSKNRQNTSMKMIIIAAVFAILSTAMAEPKFYSYEAHFGDNGIATEDVEFDEEEQYAIITVTPITGRITATIDYHDFITRYLAIKNDKRKTCYIFRSPETMEEMMDKLEESVERNGFIDISRSFVCTSKKFVPNDEISGRYGERIADFCEGFDVIQSEAKLVRKTRSVKFLAGDIMGCDRCWFSRC